MPSPGGAQLSTAGALDFCASSPAAVVLTVWPSGTNHISEVMQWLDGCGARVVHSQSVPLATPLSELLTVMALYDGEEWLEYVCRADDLLVSPEHRHVCALNSSFAFETVEDRLTQTRSGVRH